LLHTRGLPLNNRLGPSGDGEIVDGGVQKPVEFFGRIQFRSHCRPRASARKTAGTELAERGVSAPFLPSGDQGHKVGFAPPHLTREPLKNALSDAQTRSGLTCPQLAAKLNISMVTLDFGRLISD
jgi:hypothetical protein